MSRVGRETRNQTENTTPRREKKGCEDRKQKAQTRATTCSPMLRWLKRIVRRKRRRAVAPLPLPEAIAVSEAEVEAVLAELYTEIRGGEGNDHETAVVVPTLLARDVVLLDIEEQRRGVEWVDEHQETRIIPDEELELPHLG